MNLYQILKLFVQPRVLFPLLYLSITNIFPPHPGGMVTYIYTKVLGITVQELAIVDNTAQIMYYILLFFLVNKIKTTPLWKIFIMGNLAKLVVFLQVFIFVRSLPKFWQLFFRFTVG